MKDGSTLLCVKPIEERRHRPSSDRWWAECFEFDVAASPNGAPPLFAKVTLLPNQQRAWFWAAVIDDPYVLCRDDELALPQAGPIELRGGGLWMHAICESPLEHWTVAMEAFAIAFDDPTEAWRSERGDRIGLAFDLEWECASGDVVDDGGGSNGGDYRAVCRVSGDLQVSDDRWDVDALGRRRHAWGPLLDIVGGESGPSSALLTAPLQCETPNGTRQLLRWSDATEAPPRWREQFIDLGGDVTPPC